MDYKFVHYGLYVRPKWIVGSSNMDYMFVQNGLQIHLVLLKKTWDEGDKWG
jgi:hypothetical protein